MELKSKVKIRINLFLRGLFFNELTFSLFDEDVWLIQLSKSATFEKLALPFLEDDVCFISRLYELNTPPFEPGLVSEEIILKEFPASFNAICALATSVRDPKICRRNVFP